MRILITGVAGLIGREVTKELSSSHELFLIDCKPLHGFNSIVADLAQYDMKTDPSSAAKDKPLNWKNSFEDVEVVIHLAEDSDPNATWHRVLQNNMHATWNVLQVAVEHKVRRVIYASSNFAVKALEQEIAPACYEPDGPKIDSNAEPRPINPYGIGKACGEITGRMLVEQNLLNAFIAVRIGWYHPDHPRTEGYKRMAILTQDLRGLFRRCVEAEIHGFHVVYGVSAQKTSPYDLTYTRQLLSWDPKQVP